MGLILKTAYAKNTMADVFVIIQAQSRDQPAMRPLKSKKTTLAPFT